jgi:DNA-binding beta-propeller fold protein YncE
MKRFLWLGFLAFLFAICTGCGDTFRPVIIPNPPKFPDPRASHSVMAVNDNGDARGSNMVVDVSGDTDVGVADMGVAPVHAVQQTASQVLVVNQGAGNDSLTKIGFSGTRIVTTSTISLPLGSAPNFVATTEFATAYVSLPGLVPPSVGVVSTSANTLVTTLQVGNNPVAIAETPDGKKLYVASQGSGSVSGFNTLDHSPRNPPITLSSPPIWLAARSDNQRVYILEANGTLATLDTTSTAGPDTLTESTISAPGAAYMVYDGHLNRLYIPSGGQLTVVNAATSQPQLIGAPVAIATVSPASRSTTDVCFDNSGNPPPAVTAIAAAALPDGTRVYVGSFYIDGAGNICPQVTAINTAGNTVKTAAAVPGFPGIAPFSPPICATTRFRFMMAAGGDSSRVYLASCDAGNVNIIDTANDTYLLNLPAAPSARPAIPPNTQPPPQNPVFLIAGP